MMYKDEGKDEQTQMWRVCWGGSGSGLLVSQQELTTYALKEVWSGYPIVCTHVCMPIYRTSMLITNTNDTS